MTEQPQSSTQWLETKTRQYAFYGELTIGTAILLQLALVGTCILGFLGIWLWFWLMILVSIAIGFCVNSLLDYPLTMRNYLHQDCDPATLVWLSTNLHQRYAFKNLYTWLTYQILAGKLWQGQFTDVGAELENTEVPQHDVLGRWAYFEVLFEYGLLTSDEQAFQNGFNGLNQLNYLQLTNRQQQHYQRNLIAYRAIYFTLSEHPNDWNLVDLSLTNDNLYKLCLQMQLAKQKQYLVPGLAQIHLDTVIAHANTTFYAQAAQQLATQLNSQGGQADVTQ